MLTPQLPDLISVKPSKKKSNCRICNPAKPKLPTGTRRIKIQPKFVERVSKNSFVPFIMLSGKWLLKAGFECEQHVIIVEEPGLLTIRLEKE